MIDAAQLRDLVTRSLEWAQLEGPAPAAGRLVLGTIAHESRRGTYLRQIRGPALGIAQMEPATFVWLRDRFASRVHGLAFREAAELEWDLRLAIVTCRLRYLVVPTALPDGDDVWALARYWKRHYNTYLGAGRPEQFVAALEEMGGTP